MGFLVILSVILLGGSQVSGSCSESEYAGMQATFSNCSSEFTQKTEDICHLLESVVVECSKIWLACHSQREVDKMRDLHINHLIKSYQEDNNLENCRVVKEYRMSGRAEGQVEEEVLCDDVTTNTVLKKQSNCSHAISTQVYADIQDLTSVSTISAKLCAALSAMGTVCVKDLNQCFATDDILQMRKSHLQEMKTFLLVISKEKVSSDALDNCKILDYTEDQLSPVTEVIENQSDKEATTIAVSRAKTATTTTTSTEGRVPVKGSRSAEFSPDSEDDEDIEDDEDEEEEEVVHHHVTMVVDTSTEAAERLHSRHSSSSSCKPQTVIILVLSLLSIYYIL